MGPLSCYCCCMVRLSLPSLPAFKRSKSLSRFSLEILISVSIECSSRWHTGRFCCCCCPFFKTSGFFFALSIQDRQAFNHLAAVLSLVPLFFSGSTPHSFPFSMSSVSLPSSSCAPRKVHSLCTRVLEKDLFILMIASASSCMQVVSLLRGESGEKEAKNIA